MRSFLVVICILIFLQCSRQGQLSFLEITKQVNFNGPIEKSGLELVEQYGNIKDLSLVSHPEGFTTYPPLSGLADSEAIEDWVFRFESHPFVPFKFRTGKLTIPIRVMKGQPVLGPPSIKFMFDTKVQSELAYQYLVDVYEKVSTRKRFSRQADSQTAEFTDNNSKSIGEVTFLQGKGNIIDGPYILIFGIGNDLDIEKH